MTKALLITGGTGQQGGALIKELVSRSADFTIVAVTRKPDSPSAQKLASLSPNIKVIQGDLNDVPAIFTAARAVAPVIWGVYSVQLAMGVANSVEIAQGKAMVDESLKHGVKHFVYSSVDRGGDKISYENETNVPHFMTKYQVEHHLVDSAKGTDMRYTILRPVAFMDSLAHPFFGKVFISALATVLPDNKGLQMVDIRDIGHFAAEAFVHQDRWSDRSVSIAGDDTTIAQLDTIFREKAGVPLPRSFSAFGYMLRFAITDVRRMLNFFAETGYGADVAALRKEYPGLRSVSDWVEDNKSKFA